MENQLRIIILKSPGNHLQIQELQRIKNHNLVKINQIQKQPDGRLAEKKVEMEHLEN